jgi:small subunit ribosomal protein S9
MKKDPSHEHYLKNHLMMWIDDYRKFINFGGFGNQHKTIPMVPWEYLKLQKPNQLKVKRESKVAIDEEGYVSSTGKRKTARAKASVRNGTGIITINGKNMVHYCPDLISRDRIVRPLMVSKLVGLIDVKAEVHGGGFMGQSFALRQAISKALIRYIPECSKIICSSGLIERDPRQVERKKTSKHKARKSYTFVKR